MLATSCIGDSYPYITLSAKTQYDPFAELMYMVPKSFKIELLNLTIAFIFKYTRMDLFLCILNVSAKTS